MINLATWKKLNAMTFNEYAKEYYQDNGFLTAKGMATAHNVLICAIQQRLHGRLINVLDLGCGNGALLWKLTVLEKGCVPFGVEINKGKVENARVLMPEWKGNIIVGDMFSMKIQKKIYRYYDLAMFMPGRLKEVPIEKCKGLITFLKKNAKEVFVYAYDDTISRYEGLVNLVESIGFSVEINKNRGVIECGFITNLEDVI